MAAGRRRRGNDAIARPETADAFAHRFHSARPLVAEPVLANDFYEPGITFEILVVHRVVERGRVAFGTLAVAGAKQQ